ncbi:MAG TPA: FHA domain-containing protein [Kofleriaceae bacterium]|nr:FHA domain-containing protein [Kofleriaceae bacterium]
MLAIIIIAALGKPRGAAKQLMCGSCRRVMMPSWTRCMFCGWQPPASVPRLEFVGGPLAGQTVPLQEEVTTNGSVAGNTVVLSDPAVSRKHLGIRRVGSKYELADLGSTNGVYVNGHRMGKKMLVSGDIMRVGNTEMVFRVE